MDLSLLKAAAPVHPGHQPAARRTQDRRRVHRPDTFTRRVVVVEREHASAYAAVCGFPAKDAVPLTYPHMLAFPLHMAIMTSQDFPFPAIGTVHVENSITGHRPIHPGESLDVAVSAQPARPHAKGQVVDFVARVSSGDELVWESTSTYLHRGRGDESAPAGLDLPPAPEGTTQWRLPADLGRRYAAVSGDANPIHLTALTAKALGFPRAIAHGMWSLARVVAAVENRLPDAVAWTRRSRSRSCCPAPWRSASTTTRTGSRSG